MESARHQRESQNQQSLSVYCVKPILQSIPSLAIKWPKESPKKLSVLRRGSLGEGNTMIDLRLEGLGFDRNYQGEIIATIMSESPDQKYCLDSDTGPK